MAYLECIDLETTFSSGLREMPRGVASGLAINDNTNSQSTIRNAIPAYVNLNMKPKDF